MDCADYCVDCDGDSDGLGRNELRMLVKAQDLRVDRDGATENEAFFAFCRKLPALSPQREEILEKIFGINPKSLYLCTVDQNKQHLSDKRRK